MFNMLFIYIYMYIYVFLVMSRTKNIHLSPATPVTFILPKSKKNCNRLATEDSKACQGTFAKNRIQQKMCVVFFSEPHIEKTCVS